MNYTPIVENARMNYTCVRGVVLRDHQQIMVVDGHVCKLTKKKKSCDFFICKNSLFGKCETGRGGPAVDLLNPIWKHCK